MQSRMTTALQIFFRKGYMFVGFVCVYVKKTEQAERRPENTLLQCNDKKYIYISNIHPPRFWFPREKKLCLCHSPQLNPIVYLFYDTVTYYFPFIHCGGL